MGSCCGQGPPRSSSCCIPALYLGGLKRGFSGPDGRRLPPLAVRFGEACRPVLLSPAGVVLAGPMLREDSRPSESCLHGKPSFPDHGRSSQGWTALSCRVRGPEDACPPLCQFSGLFGLSPSPTFQSSSVATTSTFILADSSVFVGGPGSSLCHVTWVKARFSFVCSTPLTPESHPTLCSLWTVAHYLLCHS